MKRIFYVALIAATLVFSLSGCRKNTTTRLSSPQLSLNSDGTISVTSISHADKYYFKVGSVASKLDLEEAVELDLNEFRLDYSTFILCYCESNDSKYTRSGISNILSKEFTNDTFDTTLINGLKRQDNEIDYKTNYTGSDLVISFSFDNDYQDESFKIMINGGDEITINNNEFYDSLRGTDTTINSIRVITPDPSLIDVKVSNITFNEDVSFDSNNLKIVYTKSCSLENYTDDVVKEKLSVNTNISELLNNTTSNFFNLSGYVLNRSNDNSLSSYLFDKVTGKYILVESYSLFNTAFKYEYEVLNNKFNITYQEKSNLINNTEYAFSDGDYIKVLLYKDTNNKYYAEYISKDNTKKLSLSNKEFSVTNITNDYLTLTLDKTTYGFKEYASIEYNLSTNYYINKLNVIRFNGEKELITLNELTNKYEYQVMPFDKLEVDISNITYKLFTNSNDNNNYYFTKVTYSLFKDETSYDYLYKITNDELDYTNLSSSVIKKIEGYIYSIDSEHERLVIVNPTDKNNIKMLNISSLSKLNSSFDLLDNANNNSYASYNNSYSFDELNLELNKYISLFVLYNSELNVAYGELLNIDSNKSLLNVEVYPTFKNNSTKSTISFTNTKESRLYNEEVTIKVVIDDTESIKNLRVNRLDGTVLNLTLNDKFEASFNLSFNDEIELETKLKNTTKTVTIYGDTSKDEVEMYYTQTGQADGSIKLKKNNPIYNTESLNTIKEIKITKTACQPGTLKVYGSTSVITNPSSLTPVDEVSIVAATNEYTISFKDTSYNYFYIEYSAMLLTLSSIVITTSI